MNSTKGSRRAAGKAVLGVWLPSESDMCWRWPSDQNLQHSHTGKDSDTGTGVGKHLQQLTSQGTFTQRRCPSVMISAPGFQRLQARKTGHNSRETANITVLTSARDEYA